MVSHAPVALDSKARTRVAAAAPAFRELLELGVLGWNVHLDGDQLVAALAVLAGEAAALQPEHFSRASALRDGEHHWPFSCRDLHLCAEHGLLERHRQLQADV